MQVFPIRLRKAEEGAARANEARISAVKPSNSIGSYCSFPCVALFEPAFTGAGFITSDAHLVSL
jgi:hypothetical protein